MSGKLKSWSIDLEKYRYLLSEAEYENLQAFLARLRFRGPSQ